MTNDFINTFLAKKFAVYGHDVFLAAAGEAAILKAAQNDAVTLMGDGNFCTVVPPQRVPHFPRQDDAPHLVDCPD